ncbi:transposase [Paraburkholderia sp. GAS334]|uniref:transposase n=1 Tax=Paraburkholderia sp. GAS334 TaxID=3035131 RepID=UPI003D1A3F18
MRSLIEAQISRIKRWIGATLLTRKIASQENEGMVIANVINLWNTFGRPVCAKNA